MGRTLVMATATVFALCVGLSACSHAPAPSPITRIPVSGDRRPPVDVPNPQEQIGRPGNAVVIVDASFTPTSIAIKAGQSVTWTNNDRVAHSVTVDGSFDIRLKRGASWKHRFPTAGTVAYRCRIHPANPFMRGVVVVS
jgi:plastocyanin